MKDGLTLLKKFSETLSKKNRGQPCYPIMNIHGFSFTSLKIFQLN